jgi:predicted DNA-binding transcriptional regulator AlpA
MTLDTQKMHSDILKRLNAINKPQKHLTEKLGISRATFWRLSKGHEMKVNTFLKLVEWLEQPVTRYLKEELQKQ